MNVQRWTAAIGLSLLVLVAYYGPVDAQQAPGGRDLLPPPSSTVPPSRLPSEAPPAVPAKPPANQPTRQELDNALNRQPVKIEAGDDEMTKLLKARFNAAVQELKVNMQAYELGLIKFDLLVNIGRRLHYSGWEIARTDEERIAECEMNLVLARTLENRIAAQAAAGAAGGEHHLLANATYWRCDAEVQLLRCKQHAARAKAAASRSSAAAPVKCP